MTIRMYAARKGWDLQSASITIRRGPAEDAHAPHLFEKELTVSGELDEAQKARLLEIADKCPVHRTLNSEIQIRTRATR
jgi:putative redox protein